MKHLPLLAAAALMACACSTGNKTALPDGPRGLRDVLADDYLFGAAVDTATVNGHNPAADSILRRHYNSIVAENCMKSMYLAPEQGQYFWADADSFVNYGERNGMAIIGHTLVWHSQLAPWMPLDFEGNEVSADTLRARMTDYITTVVGRYKGRIKGWDVVNEAILDDGTYRDSPFYRILGEEFIPIAFEAAHKADPEAELYLNDYSMASPAKRDAYVRIANDLKQRGLRIDGIGMQGHMGMDYPDFAEFEKSIEAFGATGCNVMITEWDMSVLPYISASANITDTVAYNKIYNPYADGILPDSVAAAWNARASDFIDLTRRHADVITRFTTWGVEDGGSWKNDYPMKGRVEYPLLFDRNHQLKDINLKAELEE